MIHTSEFWKCHFEVNLTRKRIDWDQKPQLTANEKENILTSLKAFQLGETGDGLTLLAASRRYGARIGDVKYADAAQLFVYEEQKHGANLGRYIDLLGEERLKKNWGNSAFRFIRHLNKNMEIWTITVLIVELAAQVFYQALHDATQCTLLRSICKDILIDEAHHIKFQNERLFTIFQRKGFYNKAFSLGFYALLFFGTIHAIWFAHHKAIKAGGINKPNFMRMMYYKFLKSMQFLYQSEEKMYPVPALARKVVG